MRKFRYAISEPTLHCDPGTDSNSLWRHAASPPGRLHKDWFHLEVLSFETFFWPFLNPSPACPPSIVTCVFQPKKPGFGESDDSIRSNEKPVTSEICDVFLLKNPQISLNWMKNHGFVESLYRNYLKQVNQAAFNPSTEPQTQTFFLGTHTASVANPEK